jgi:plastocyanin
MRFCGLTLLASAGVLVACGVEKNASTSDSAATATAAGANATAGTAAPITGITVEVKMLQDEQGNYKFDPADVTIKAGDGVKFVLVSGEPHNVAFDPAQVPPNAKAQLSANMPMQVSELSSPMMLKPNESYTISFGEIPPGKYEFHCTPHLAMGMKGSVTVQ